MSKKIEIIGYGLIITDTVSGLVEISQPSKEVWYNEVKLQAGIIKIESVRFISESDEHILYPEFPLSNAVNSSLVAFTESTFRAFMTVNSGGSNLPKNFYLEVQKGNIAGHSIVHKSGLNVSLNSSWAVVSPSGLYQVPTTAQSLELVSDNANDTAAGSGARTVFFQGLDANFEIQSETITTNGLTAVPLVNTYIRGFRAYVVSSGTYASLTSASHVGTIKIQGAGAGVEWIEIPIIGTFPSGQSAVAVYTIPAGKTGYFVSKSSTVEGNKPVDLSLFKRENADDVTSPYSGVMRLIEHDHGLTSEHSLQPVAPFAPLPEKTDIGFIAKTATSGSISADFEILLIDN